MRDVNAGHVNACKCGTQYLFRINSNKLTAPKIALAPRISAGKFHGNFLRMLGIKFAPFGSKFYGETGGVKL